MRSALLVLAMPRCLDASRNATLNVVESLIDLEGNLGYNILMAHVDQLLESLRAIAVTAWSTPVSLLVSLASSQGAIASTCIPLLSVCCSPVTAAIMLMGPSYHVNSALRQQCVSCIA